jgi:heme O synthase-like polyprenyltransferase
MTGIIYLAGATLSGAALLAASIRFHFDRGTRNARSLFMISNLYLLTVMLLLVVNAHLGLHRFAVILSRQSAAKDP